MSYCTLNPGPKREGDPDKVFCVFCVMLRSVTQSGAMTTATTTSSASGGRDEQKTVTWWAARASATARESSSASHVSVPTSSEEKWHHVTLNIFTVWHWNKSHPHSQTDILWPLKGVRVSLKHKHAFQKGFSQQLSTLLLRPFIAYCVII